MYVVRDEACEGGMQVEEEKFVYESVNVDSVEGLGEVYGHCDGACWRFLLVKTRGNCVV